MAKGVSHRINLKADEDEFIKELAKEAGVFLEYNHSHVKWFIRKCCSEKGFVDANQTSKAENIMLDIIKGKGGKDG